MCNLNPYYNESFVFIVEQEMLRVQSQKTTLICTVDIENTLTRGKFKSKYLIHNEQYAQSVVLYFANAKDIVYGGCVSSKKLMVIQLRLQMFETGF